MKQLNRRLTVVVAAAAVAAVVGGGAIAYRQGPQSEDTSAGPLTAQTGTPTPALSTPPSPRPTPSATPPAQPPTSTPVYSGPITIELDVKKLAAGRAPQVPYLVGREVRGGLGPSVKIPGFAPILQVVRRNTAVLAVVGRQPARNELLDYGSDLLTIDGSDVQKTVGVTSVVTTEDQSATAYAAERYDAKNTVVQGGDVYARVDESVQRLKVPNSWNIAVLAFRGAWVYFQYADTSGGTRKLYAWKTGTTKATAVPAVTSPVAIAADSSVAVSVTRLALGSCSLVTALTTGKQLWRTCDNQLVDLTPDSRTVLGRVTTNDDYCDETVVAQDAGSGKLIRQWKGCFQDVVAEDDQNFLFVAVYAGNGLRPGTKKAIIRCNVGTGHCERATPITVDQQLSLHW